MKELLLVKNVSLYFRMYEKGLRQKNVHTLNKLNISVCEGEVVTIIGSSGSGKSLLAHAILGILPINAHLSGEIYYKEQLLTKKYQTELRGKEIALVPQAVTYFDQLMKVGKQAQGKNISKEAQRKAFQRYGLSESDEQYYPFQLSGGMARRALVSTAIAGGAKLIIADEPTPGLSEDLGREVMQNFRELADEGRGVLIITHDIDLALTVADRIYVFHDGYTVEAVSAENFKLGNFKHPYTKALYDALPQNGFVVPKVSIDDLIKEGVK